MQASGRIANCVSRKAVSRVTFRFRFTAVVGSWVRMYAVLSVKSALNYPNFWAILVVQSAVWRFPFWSFWKMELLLYVSASVLSGTVYNFSTMADVSAVDLDIWEKDRAPNATRIRSATEQNEYNVKSNAHAHDSVVSESSAFATPAEWCTHSSNSIYGWTSENGINANCSNISFTTASASSRVFAIFHFPLFAYAECVIPRTPAPGRPNPPQ